MDVIICSKIESFAGPPLAYVEILWVRCGAGASIVGILVEIDGSHMDLLFWRRLLLSERGLECRGLDVELVGLVGVVQWVVAVVLALWDGDIAAVGCLD